MFKENLFKKIENKTSINKETILTLADKIKKYCINTFQIKLSVL